MHVKLGAHRAVTSTFLATARSTARGYVGGPSAGLSAIGRTGAANPALHQAVRLADGASWRNSHTGLLVAERIRALGERLNFTRLLALAVAAMALENQRRESLAQCDIGLDENRSLLNYEAAEMGFFQRVNRALRALRRIGEMRSVQRPTPLR